MPEDLPAPSPACVPSAICGVAELTDFAYQGNGFAAIEARIETAHAGASHPAALAARLYDTSVAHLLAFSRATGLALQDEALAASPLYRIRGGVPERNAAIREPPSARPLRVLAIAAPGDFMANTPLDFITSYLDVRLDILHVVPGQPLPPAVPEHDVAFFCAGDAEGSDIVRLAALRAAWPRPTLNDPALLPLLARDRLAATLSGLPGLRAPEAVTIARTALETHGAEAALGHSPYPSLIRPRGSHAGHGLARLAGPGDLAEHLACTTEADFCLTRFVNYASPDGLYRKYRVAFVDQAPFLCHMAVSRNWMVHYLNAGMADCEAKRAEEEAAMAGFPAGFARRHAAAFARLHARLGFDYYSIDCAETQDGRLLVFEADTAAIVHLMDPPDPFAYKQPQIRAVFRAFGTMLRRAANCAVAA